MAIENRNKRLRKENALAQDAAAIKDEEKEARAHEQIKKLLLSESKIIGGYLLIGLLCWAFFSLSGTQDYIWEWVTEHFMLYIAGGISALALLCGMKKLSISLLLGTAIGIPVGDIFGRISVNSSPLGFNSGWIVFLLVLNVAAAVGIIIQLQGNGKKEEGLPFSPFCKKYLTGILTFSIICLILISSSSSCTRLSFMKGAEAGYQAGAEAGREALAAGKSWNSSTRGKEYPAEYTFGSSEYSGYMCYWSTGYEDGYPNPNESGTAG